MKLEDLTPNAAVEGILGDSLVTVVSVQWYGDAAVEITYKSPSGEVANELLYRDDESRISIAQQARPWSFDGDGALFRVVSEARRIRLAHLFDPLLAVHTSDVEPFPHQITAVYEEMLPRAPLRFLLADDPGAGKTIMAGLLIKELIARGDLQRCLVVCPGALAEQWQDELFRRFQLPFEILTNDKLEAARSGNWFLETNLVIARLDKLARDEEVQQKLKARDCDWDLVVCDEAHKMSAGYYGSELRYTKRYHLGRTLSDITRHFLLMTATPHNGKEEDFQLFMALLDEDRFEGKFRKGVHSVDVSDLMRRMVKEKLLTFDGKPLFPERIAYTISYKLSPEEERLYKAVTQYVREEFDRAGALENDRRAGAVGFALTILQRRLASSPEAIYRSLRRRRERLQGRLEELESQQLKGEFRPPAAAAASAYAASSLGLDSEELEDLEDAPESEIEAQERQVLDEATAAQTIDELKREINTLSRLQTDAGRVLRVGRDAKWRQLGALIDRLFINRFGETPAPYGSGKTAGPAPSPQQKLVIFTEHRDTLTYLRRRIADRLGREEAVVIIHGGLRRDQRNTAQEAFRHDPHARVLLATDAAGEGINLQRAHLMVNYDLPWNPNRLEQRFGRIHRIGQTEVCHLWNLVASETREGDVYSRLLEKLEQARSSLGGQVFDVLGKLRFEGRPLRDLLVEAIRYGERPEVRARLETTVENAFDRDKLRDLLDERSLAPDAMDASRVQRVRARMERAQARRLQPHYVESFFLEAFRRLGGRVRRREPRRYEITHVPASLRNRDHAAGMPVLRRYERIAFEKSFSAAGRPQAAFVCPGHPLLDVVIDGTLHGHRDLLKQGAVLVDERDQGTEPRLLFFLEHAIQDASVTRAGARRVISKRMLYVEIDAAGNARHRDYAPYLDYRPLHPREPSPDAVLGRSECAWVAPNLEPAAQRYAVAHVVPEHVQEIRTARLPLIDKTRDAVQARLSSEIAHWDRRAEDLKPQEQAGRANARLNSAQARRRADRLEERLAKRLADLELERRISPRPPVALGAALVVPLGLIRIMQDPPDTGDRPVADTQAAAARARRIVMQVERGLGYRPTDREFEKRGYDIESRDPASGRLRFLEVKGRVSGAPAITVTRNEILYSLNKPDAYILAIVEFLDGNDHRVHYLRQPFQREPDFGVTSVNYSFADLLARAGPPC